MPIIPCDMRGAVGLLLGLWLVVGAGFAQQSDIVWRRPILTAEALAVSPDGQYITVACEGNSVAIYRRNDLQLVRLLRGHLFPVSALAFSPNSQQLASLDAGGTLIVWQASTGNTLWTANVGGSGTAVTYSPDGALIAVGSSGDAVRLYNTTNGTLTRALTGHTSGVASLAFAPDGQSLATGDMGGTVCIWRVSNGTLQHTFTAHPDSVSALVFSPDGTRLATGGFDAQVRLWLNSGTGWEQERVLTGHFGGISALLFNATGDALYSAGFDGTIKEWNPSTGQEGWSIDAHEWGVNGLALIGSQLISAGNDHTVRLWNASDGSPQGTIREHATPVRGIGLASGGEVVSVELSGKLYRWSASSGVFQSMTDLESYVACGEVSPDGTRIAIGTMTGSVLLRSLPTGTSLASWQAHNEEVLAVAFSPDGTRLATASFDGTAKVWNLPSGTLVRTFTEHTGTVNAVAFSPDGTTLATGDAVGTIRLWNIANGNLIATLSGHSETITGLTFRPNNQHLASCSTDGTIRIWDLATSGLYRQIPAHESGVNRILYLSDSSALVSAGSDGSIRFWDATTGNLIRQVNAHQGILFALALSPDNTVVASGGEDGIALVWTSGPPNQPPNIPVLIQPTSGATVGRTPSFEVQLSDPDGDQVRAHFEITDANNQVRTYQSNWVSGGSVYLTIAPEQPLAPGTYRWQARAEDERGAFSAWSESRTFTVANTPPGKPVILEPPNNATVGATPTFRFHLSDPEGDQVQVRIEVSRTGVPPVTFETSLVPSGSEVSFTVPADQALAPGTYQWRAKAIDAYGAESGWTDPRQFTVPSANQVPAIPELISPSNGATVSPTPTFRVRLSDPDGNQVKAEIEIATSTGNTLQFETGFVSSGSEATLTLNNAQALSAGTYRWRARARDSIGDYSEWTDQWTFTVSTGNRAPNMPDLIEPEDNAPVTPTPTFRVRLSDPDGDRVSARIQVNRPDGSVLELTTAQVASGAEASVSVSTAQALAPGNYTWQARAIDSQGAQGDWSPPRRFTIPEPNNPPNAPELLSPEEGATTSRTPILRLRATDPESDLISFEIEITQDSTRRTFTTDQVPSGAILTFPVPEAQPLPVGTLSWRARARDAQGNLSAWSQTRTFRTAEEVKPTLIGITSFSLSLQVADASISALGLTGAQIVRWNPNTNAYEPVDRLQVGEGYFVHLSAPTRLDVSGQPITGEVAIPLTPRWNLISSPYLNPLVWGLDTIRVRRGNETRTLREAQQAGWVEDYLWGWQQNPQNPSQGAYQLVYDPSLLPGSEGALQPWRAYWILAYEPCTLLLNPATRTRHSPQLPMSNQWSLRIQAWNAEGGSEVVIGVGRDLLASPPPSAYGSERAPQILARRAEGSFAVEFRSEFSRSARWQFEVRVPPADSPQAITLHVPNALQLPRQVQLVLIDEQSGKRIPLRTRAHYTFTAPASGGVFRFSIERISSSALLRVLNPTVRLARARGESHQIGFTLTTEAQVQIQIRSAGRVVRTLSLGSTRSAGYHQLVWDGRDERGIALPPGQYLVEITAQTEDGQSARVAVPLLSVR